MSWLLLLLLTITYHYYILQSIIRQHTVYSPTRSPKALQFAVHRLSESKVLAYPKRNFPTVSEMP